VGRRHLEEVPIDLARQLKVQAARLGITKKELIEKILREALEKARGSGTSNALQEDSG
jgi:AAA+ superfamily predicted ATPase